MRTAQEIRSNVDALGKRLEIAALADEPQQNGTHRSATPASIRRIEIQSIIADIKQLIVDIDDSIPLINLWVSAMGGIQTQTSSFSPSRLLQASMLVNVGDMQYVVNPGQPMQIGPDFGLTLYMLFRAHVSSADSGDPYGLEEGQQKPLWQEVIHKARVRLRRVPRDEEFPGANGLGNLTTGLSYTYQLQIVEDQDDGRVHTSEEGHDKPCPYDGISLAGIREFIPVRQISKMFYADVGRILNINHEDGASSHPVLLLKRDVNAKPQTQDRPSDLVHIDQPRLIQDMDESHASNGTLDSDSDDEANRQLQLESECAKAPRTNHWKLPQDVDPEWIALEVFDLDNDSDTDATEEEEESAAEDDIHEKTEDSHLHPTPRRLRPCSSVDSNLVTQLNRMSIASRSPSRASGELTRNDANNHSHNPHDEDLLERSPFGAIQTSLSLLEMLLRLTSLQEFEQTTHLAIPDHVLRFYLDESASRADPDAPVHHGVGVNRS